jgi:hypothetical protein
MSFLRYGTVPALVNGKIELAICRRCSMLRRVKPRQLVYLLCNVRHFAHRVGYQDPKMDIQTEHFDIGSGY